MWKKVIFKHLDSYFAVVQSRLIPLSISFQFSYFQNDQHENEEKYSLIYILTIFK